MRQGWSLRAIAAEIGVTATTVQRDCAAMACLPLVPVVAANGKVHTKYVVMETAFDFDSPTCRYCRLPLHACFGAHGGWMHDDQREHCADGRVAEPFRLDDLADSQT